MHDVLTSGIDDVRCATSGSRDKSRSRLCIIALIAARAVAGSTLYIAPRAPTKAQAQAASNWPNRRAAAKSARRRLLPDAISPCKSPALHQSPAPHVSTTRFVVMAADCVHRAVACELSECRRYWRPRAPSVFISQSSFSDLRAKYGSSSHSSNRSTEYLTMSTSGSASLQ